MKSTTKIVLSGGPGGGKSKSLNRLITELKKYGYTVYPVFESAEEILKNGFERGCSVYEFQKAIALNQLKRENELENSIKDKEKSVIICDRGLMDARVYLNDEDFIRFKDEMNLSDIELRDRYDAVFHLDSTSNHASVEYIMEGIRIESEIEAQEINARSLKSWCGNPHYRFIPVQDSFEKKFELLFKEIKHFLGIPKPLEIERKFLIKYPDTDYLLSLPCEKCEITQAYLTDGKIKFRLRKRGADGHYIYIKTEKNKISETVREEIETRLTEEEYNCLIKSNLITGVIDKERYCLMYGGTYYEIDIFPFWKKQAYIEIELSDENEEIRIPEFIDVIREVTYDPRYKNSRLSNHIPEED